MGAIPGSAGTMSETGWSKGVVPLGVMAEKFLFCVTGTKPMFLMALVKGIVRFILPPHTSHIIQPLDIFYGPFEKCSTFNVTN